MTRKSDLEQEWVDSMPAYYGRRAPNYEEMWRRNDPVRQREQAAIAEVIRVHLQARRVLEVACGTGYWTQFATEVAACVCGLDASPEMLALARRRGLPVMPTRWERCREISTPGWQASGFHTYPKPASMTSWMVSTGALALTQR